MTPPLTSEHCRALAIWLAFFKVFPRDFEDESDCDLPPGTGAAIEAIISNRVNGLFAGQGRTSNSDFAAALRDEIHEIKREVLSRHQVLQNRMIRFEAESEKVCNCAVSSSNGRFCANCCCPLPVEAYCLGFFSEQFRLAKEIALKYYNRLGMNFRDELISFSTGWLDLFYRSNEMPEDIHAFPSVDPPTGVLELLLMPQIFNRPTYEVLLYLFLHEWVCHGVPIMFYRAHLENGTNFPEPPSDAFAEGWMDHIAFRIFRSATKTRPASEQQRPLDTHNFRTRFGSEPATPYWPDDFALKRRARTAAENIIREAIYLSGDDMQAGEEIGIDLSLRLNLLPFTSDQRDKLVSQARRLFPTWGEADGRPVLEEYIAHRDVQKFVDGCLL